MDILNIIKNRRSIRKYQAKKIPKEVMDNIITAGQFAPSAGNSQDFEFLIIDDKAIIGEIPAIHPHANMVLSADKVIIVLANLKRERYEGFFVQDCSAAVQNILLYAHSVGIGTVWCGIYPLKDRVESFKKLLNLPEHILPFALISMGYPDEQHNIKERQNKEAVFYNSYGKKE